MPASKRNLKCMDHGALSLVSATENDGIALAKLRHVERVKALRWSVTKQVVQQCAQEAYTADFNLRLRTYCD